MRKRRRQPDPWWSKWLAAIGLGVLSVLMLWPWFIAIWTLWTLPFDDSAGMDFEVTGPGMTWRVVGVACAVATLALPVFTVRWARKKWLGYLLLGLTLSGIAGLVGLIMMGVL